MQLFPSAVVLALVALLGASTVAGHEVIDQSHTKPFTITKGRVATAYMEVIFTSVTATPAVVNMVARFDNNDAKRLNANPPDLELRSAKMLPNMRPKVDPQVAKTTNETIITWAIPREEIVEGKKYTFVVKVKVGPNVQSGDLFGVFFKSDDAVNTFTEGNFLDFSPIVVK